MRKILLTIFFCLPGVSLANLDANDILMLLEAGKSPLNTLWVNEKHIHVLPEEPILIKSLPRNNVMCSFKGNEFMLALPSTGKVTKTHDFVYHIEINNNDRFMLIDVNKNRKHIAKIPKKENGHNESVKRHNTVSNMLNKDIESRYKNDYEYIKYSLGITPGKFININNIDPKKYLTNSNLYRDLDTLLRLITKFTSVPPETTKISLIEAQNIDAIVYYLDKKDATVINIFIGVNSFELVLGETINTEKALRLISTFYTKGTITNKACNYEISKLKVPEGLKLDQPSVSAFDHQPANISNIIVLL